MEAKTKVKTFIKTMKRPISVFVLACWNHSYFFNSTYSHGLMLWHFDSNLVDAYFTTWFPHGKKGCGHAPIISPFDMTYTWFPQESMPQHTPPKILGSCRSPKCSCCVTAPPTRWPHEGYPLPHEIHMMFTWYIHGKSSCGHHEELSSRIKRYILTWNQLKTSSKSFHYTGSKKLTLPVHPNHLECCTKKDLLFLTEWFDNLAFPYWNPFNKPFQLR